MRPASGIHQIKAKGKSKPRAAFSKGTLAMRVRDELPGLFADEQFASVFGVRRKPGISRWQRFVVGITSRSAADEEVASKDHRRGSGNALIARNPVGSRNRRS